MANETSTLIIEKGRKIYDSKEHGGQTYGQYRSGGGSGGGSSNNPKNRTTLTTDFNPLFPNRKPTKAIIIKGGSGKTEVIDYATYEKQLESPTITSISKASLANPIINRAPILSMTEKEPSVIVSSWNWLKPGFKDLGWGIGQEALWLGKQYGAVKSYVGEHTAQPLKDTYAKLESGQEYVTTSVDKFSEKYIANPIFNITPLYKDVKETEKERGEVSKSYEDLNKITDKLNDMINKNNAATEDLNNRAAELDNKINKFNEKGGSQSELYSLNKDIENFNKYRDKINNEAITLNELSNNNEYRKSMLVYGDKQLEAKEQRLTKQRESGEFLLPTLLGSAAVGAATFLPSVFNLGVKTLVNPEKSIKEQASMIVNLPGEFVKHPATTTGSLIGQSVVGELIGAGFKSKTVGKVESKPEINTIARRTGDKEIDIGGTKVPYKEVESTTIIKYPKQEILVSSPFRDLFGISPKKVEVAKAKTYTTKSTTAIFSVGEEASSKPVAVTGSGTILGEVGKGKMIKYSYGAGGTQPLPEVYLRNMGFFGSEEYAFSTGRTFSSEGYPGLPGFRKALGENKFGVNKKPVTYLSTDVSVSKPVQSVKGGVNELGFPIEYEGELPSGSKKIYSTFSTSEITKIPKRNLPIKRTYEAKTLFIGGESTDSLFGLSKDVVSSTSDIIEKPKSSKDLTTQETKAFQESVIGSLGKPLKTAEKSAAASISKAKQEIKSNNKRIEAGSGLFSASATREKSRDEIMSSFGLTNRQVESGVTIEDESTSFGLISIPTGKEFFSSGNRDRGSNRFANLVAQTPKEEQATRQVQQTVQVPGNIINLINPIKPRPERIPEPEIPKKFKVESDEDLLSSFEFGYIPEAKVRGKYVQLSKPVSKATALGIASGFTRSTLSRTFRLVPTKTKVKKSKVPFANLGQFRNYKVKQGTRVPLDNSFIQIGKYSLSSRGERKEIQSARARSSSGKRVGSLFGI